MSSSRRQPRPESMHLQNHVIEVKSKFEAEFRRFGLDRRKITSFSDFYNVLETLHSLDSQFIITYSDKEGYLLPINNDHNFQKALESLPLLRLIVQRKGENTMDISNYASTLKKKKTGQMNMNPFTLISPNPKSKTQPKISLMEDFRQVSSIVDVDSVPETHRRVKLCKQNEDKPLGFYIRDGVSVRVTETGLNKLPGIFISRLVPGGLAESTGLLSVNDEVLEVNGIEVAGKTLDQVTDMMIANSSNLIITVKPVNQNYTLSRDAPGRVSKMSTLSTASGVSGASSDSDEVKDVMTSLALSPNGRQDDVRDRCGGDGEDGEERNDEFDDEDEDLVRDHVEDAKAKSAVKRLNSGSGVGGSSIGSGDRRSIGSGKSFGSHRDSARNNGSGAGGNNNDARTTTTTTATTSRGGSAKSNDSSIDGVGGVNQQRQQQQQQQQQQRKSGVGGRSTPNGVLSARDVVDNAKSVKITNNNNKQKTGDRNSASLKSDKSDASGDSKNSSPSALRSEPTPILSL